MENFMKALDEAIHAWSQLGEQWEKIEADFSDKISGGYPFDKDFREILFDLMEWRETINK
ncbi:hypothetical protein GNQ08_00595 [Paenibacillus macerans]|uniref:Uncharacterized protein n=1 Tax=Paenibacillus macerans TaxID=44252 RepID=A0A6N8EQ98_PAEMA|nr:hypothetical protein [Paenibacillus macerans]MUG20940.1 hypothetical protein [Paenibacillus macerans]UMV48746.1 hypothetical protein LMZ02_04975 [Paenibacillus macerans]